MNTEGCMLNHTGDIDWHREHKKHASYTYRVRTLFFSVTRDSKVAVSSKPSENTTLMKKANKNTSQCLTPTADRHVHPAPD